MSKQLSKMTATEQQWVGKYKSETMQQWFRQYNSMRVRLKIKWGLHNTIMWGWDNTTWGWDNITTWGQDLK